MKHPLTKRQTEVFFFIKRFIAEKEYSPTMQEIADSFGWKSRGHVAGIITSLERRGYITRMQYIRRSIAIVTDEREELMRLREVRDAAKTFVTEQKTYGELYNENRDSLETREAAPKVSQALERLQVLIA